MFGARDVLWRPGWCFKAALAGLGRRRDGHRIANVCSAPLPGRPVSSIRRTQLGVRRRGDWCRRQRNRVASGEREILCHYGNGSGRYYGLNKESGNQMRFAHTQMVRLFHADPDG